MDTFYDSRRLARPRGSAPDPYMQPQGFHHGRAFFREAGAGGSNPLTPTNASHCVRPYTNVEKSPNLMTLGAWLAAFNPPWLATCRFHHLRHLRRCRAYLRCSPGRKVRMRDCQRPLGYTRRVPRRPGGWQPISAYPSLPPADRNRTHKN